MRDKDEVAEQHHGAADRPCLQIGNRQQHRVHERTLGIEHRVALQHPADGQPDDVNQHADECQPEVPGNELRVGPFALEYARQREIDAREHDEAEECVQAEMSVGDRRVGEVHDRADRPQGFETALDRTSDIAGSADDGETQGRRELQRAPIALHRQRLIHREGNHGHRHHDAGHYPNAHDPGGQRAADEVVHACLPVVQGKRPEPDQGQVVGRDRPSEHLRNEVVGRANGHRRDEVAKHVVAVPPVD